MALDRTGLWLLGPLASVVCPKGSTGSLFMPVRLLGWTCMTSTSSWWLFCFFDEIGAATGGDVGKVQENQVYCNEKS